MRKLGLPDLRPLIRHERMVTPDDWENQYSVHMGAVFNLAHNLGQMLDAGLCVTLNSDDPAYFGGYLNDNYVQTFAALHLSAQQAYKLAANSIEASFAPEADKHRWMHDLKQCFQGFFEQD